MSSSSLHTIGSDVAKGIKWGLMMATGLASFLVVGRILGGSKIFEGGLSFSKTLLAEFGAGLIGGLIFGLTFRCIRSVFSAALVGLLVGEVSGFAMVIADKGVSDTSAWDLGSTVPFGAVGLVVAVMLWRRLERLRAGQQSA
jgi:hypothetical protein